MQKWPWMAHFSFDHIYKVDLLNLEIRVYLLFQLYYNLEIEFNKECCCKKILECGLNHGQNGIYIALYICILVFQCSV